MSRPARSRAVGFAKVHVFSYSPRRGTPAAELDGQVRPEIVAQRRNRLRALERELADQYHKRLIGRHLDVLVEGADVGRPGYVRGTSCRYVPVAFAGHEPALVGKRVTVTVTDAVQGTLLGEPESDFTGGRLRLEMADAGPPRL